MLLFRSVCVCSISVVFGTALVGCGSKRPLGGDSGLADLGDLGDDDLGIPDFGVDQAVPGDLGQPDTLPAQLDVEPRTLQTITVAPGATTPTLGFTATLGGVPVKAAWSLDRGDIGTVAVGPIASTTFAPKGSTGGVVTLTAGVNGMTVQRQVLVKLVGQQSGANPMDPAQAGQIPSAPGDLTHGGGVGGVGGEGLGGAPTPGQATALDGATANSHALAWLYPYDGTVWPRGLPAPLLMWSWDQNDADAIRIELSTDSGSFSWTGTFGRPAILTQTGGKFVRHPIPQNVWDAATRSAGQATMAGSSDKLTVKLTVAKGSVASGPIRETWIIAPARLSGTIYYNSYGTQLAKNYSGAVGGDGKFGGAVLSIRAGDYGPKLAAGGDGAEAQCRTCHSVAANGARLMVQHGDSYGTSSAYDLSPTGATEQVMASGGKFPGLTPDGTKALLSSAQLLPLPGGAMPLATTGLTEVATALGTPSFSPDGKAVVFNPTAGPVNNPTQKLIVMDFDGSSNTFSNPRTVVDNSGAAADTRPGWPAFFPDGKSLVFHQQTKAGLDGNGEGALYTRKGALAQILWAQVGAMPTVTALDKLNGQGYLPKLPSAGSLTCKADSKQVGGLDADHADDVDHNYEPTVNPVASGGYVWVVFTSRRMYGNVATIPPFCSDPRGVDLTQNITTKKLWVAAVDLNGKPVADPSHPAFYLPGQELLAGNSRAFWVLDPCHSDGDSCETGDQCCNGYCQPNGAGGALVCSNMPPDAHCSQTQEKCETAADCCSSGDSCVNGFCAVPPIP